LVPYVFNLIKHVAWPNIWIQAFLFVLLISVLKKSIHQELSFPLREYIAAGVAAVKSHWQKVVLCQRMGSMTTALNLGRQTGWLSFWPLAQNDPELIYGDWDY
jgi:hypothetical protein